jgi:hypothetical protein
MKQIADWKQVHPGERPHCHPHREIGHAAPRKSDVWRPISRRRGIARELCELCVVKRAGCSAAKIRGHLDARSIYSVIRSKITVLK